MGDILNTEGKPMQSLADFWSAPICTSPTQLADGQSVNPFQACVHCGMVFLLAMHSEYNLAQPVKCSLGASVIAESPQQSVYILFLLYVCISV